MTDAQNRALRLAYFIIGMALPLLGWGIWNKRSSQSRKQEVDEAHDATVEDSFPASDPPSAW
jgi:hypothetical protein